VQPDLIADCVHCGFCLPTCPTYVLWREEMDSPRGRIDLMQGLADGSIRFSDTVAEHFDRCLGCLACVSSCPSGVRYDQLIEQTRAYVEQQRQRPRAEALLRTALLAVLPHRRRLQAALGLRRLPAPGPLAPLKRIAPPWADSTWPPEHLPGDGPSVAVVAGCVASVVFGDVNAATARVLHAEGYDVHVPRAQGCCGALHMHAGHIDQGAHFARELASALLGYDYIVTNAAGCGSHLKEQGFDTVVDVSELLQKPRATRWPLELRVAFQDPCHLRHAQGVRTQPRSMLDAIPGLERVEVPEQDLCCGSAGTYNVTQPDAAERLGDRKAANVLSTAPDVFASGNPGCLMQVTAALRRTGRPLPAFHPVELVDASIHAVPRTRLVSAARS